MKPPHVSTAKRLALAGMVLGATLFGSSDADAVLCVKMKKGVVAKVTIRDSGCKKKEVVGDATALLGLPTTSTTTTTTLPPSAQKRAARIVDSAGNQVAWVNPQLGALGQAVWALRTIDDQTITFPMGSNGPVAVDPVSGAVVDDFQYGFAHEGTQCVGDRFALLPDVLALVSGSGGLVNIAYPSTNGKSGYLRPFEPTPASTTVYSVDDLQVQCATPPDPVPPTVTCPFPGVPVGSAFACPPNPSLEPDPTTQCACIRCCVTQSVPPGFTVYPVRTVDLGLGNSTPPFEIER